MSIRHSLLAILDQGDCYGYQLRVEFERRTGRSRTLNVGQVYATLDRLERDALATKLGANSTGHVYYSITDAGRFEVASWFEAALTGVGLDDLAMKVALAQSLPGVDATAIVARQRQSTAAELEILRAEAASVDLSRHLVLAAEVAAAESELSWLRTAGTLLMDARPFGLEAEPPRRGRPVRT